jgi:alkaline phosphatase
MFPTKSTARRLALVALLVCLVVPCQAGGSPRNVIFFIGDGMGIGQVTIGRAANVGPNGRLAIDTMPVIGLVTTHSANALVTDSAASGTALATGFKTNNGMIAMLPDKTKLQTILEVARAMGKAIGVVTTDAATGATIAAFTSHVPSRSDVFDIASQMMASRVDVIMGGGIGDFLPKEAGGGRTDGRNLLEEAKRKGYDVVSNRDQLAKSGADRILGLFAPGVLDGSESQPSLEQMTSKSISILENDRDGFFLEVEQALSDKGSHANNALIVENAVGELDKSVRAALDFAAQHKDTLVLVTADHETGGLAVKDPDNAGAKVGAGWVSGGHSGNMVAVYAFGPGSTRFSGTHDNTDIPRILASLWGTTLSSPR